MVAWFVCVRARGQKPHTTPGWGVGIALRARDEAKTKRGLRRTEGPARSGNRGTPIWVPASTKNQERTFKEVTGHSNIFIRDLPGLNDLARMRGQSAEDALNAVLEAELSRKGKQLEAFLAEK